MFGMFGIFVICGIFGIIWEYLDFWLQSPRAARIEPKFVLEGSFGVSIHILYVYIYMYCMYLYIYIYIQICVLASVCVSLSLILSSSSRFFYLLSYMKSGMDSELCGAWLQGVASSRAQFPASMASQDCCAQLRA